MTFGLLSLTWIVQFVCLLVYESVCLDILTQVGDLGFLGDFNMKGTNGNNESCVHNMVSVDNFLCEFLHHSCLSYSCWSHKACQCVCVGDVYQRNEGVS